MQYWLENMLTVNSDDSDGVHDPELHVFDRCSVIRLPVLSLKAILGNIYNRHNTEMLAFLGL